MGRKRAICSATALSPRSVSSMPVSAAQAPHSAGGTMSGRHSHTPMLAMAPASSTVCWMPTTLSPRQHGSQNNWRQYANAGKRARGGAA
jgi:hypothetical protein